MTNTRRDRFPLLAMLGLCLPLFARFEADEQGEGGGGGGQVTESETAQDAGASDEPHDQNETSATEAGTTEDGAQETQEAAGEAGEEGAANGGQPATPTLQDILARLGAATAIAPAAAAKPGATAAAPAPKAGETAEGNAAAAASLGMTEEELADVEAQMPVGGKKLVATLKAQQALLEALKGDYDQRQEQSQQQAVVAKHRAIDEAIKDIPGASDRYGTSANATPEQIQERNTTWSLANAVFTTMRDAKTPISEREAWSWAHTLREGKAIDQPAAIRVVRSEVKARNRQMTIPSGTGRAAAKPDARKDAADFFNNGLKQLTGQG